MTLTEEQEAAARWRPTDGDTVVVAAAGAGKTTLLVETTRRLIASRPSMEIVVLTFTAKVGEELRRRLGTVPAAVFVGTMHAYALRQRSTVDRTAWSTKRCVDLGAKVRSPDVPHKLTLIRRSFTGTGDAKEVQTHLDYWRARGLTDAEVPAGCPPVIASGMKVYADLLRTHRAWDFDSCLAAEIAAVRSGSTSRIVLVDEAQDMNRIGFDYVNLLKGRQGASFLVGDVRQSVYAFRGAAPDEFDLATSRARRFDLTVNFRSQPSIIETANRVPFPGLPAMNGHRSGAGSVSVWSCAQQEDEDNRIAVDIKRRLDRGEDPNRFAVIARTNGRIAEIRAELEAMDIPVRVRSGSLFDLREARALGAYVILGHGAYPKALIEVLNVPFRGFNFDQATKWLLGQRGSGRTTTELVLGLPTGGANSKSQLVALLQSIAAAPTWEAKVDRAGDYLLSAIRVEKGKKAHERGDMEAGEGAIRAAARVARTFGRHGADALRRFAEFIDREREPPDASTLPAVTLTTAHAAKGLEWSTVFVLASDGEFPHPKGDTEEERRLFYVAITRAADELVFVQHGEPSMTLRTVVPTLSTGPTS